MALVAPASNRVLRPGRWVVATGGEVSVVRGWGAIGKIDGLFSRSFEAVRIGGWGNYWFYEGSIIIG